jgi:hypothetical protein
MGAFFVYIHPHASLYMWALRQDREVTSEVYAQSEHLMFCCISLMRRNDNEVHALLLFTQLGRRKP